MLRLYVHVLQDVSKEGGQENDLMQENSEASLRLIFRHLLRSLSIIRYFVWPRRKRHRSGRA